ncbi:MAG: hypothetical protein JW788_06805 [Candidatus Omnitrophica bacterium]|nr:hypothetical protein [Candidatus Omnitrophota bacterium]
MANNSYSINKENQLVIQRGAKKSAPRGKFVNDRNNRLIYLFREKASWRREWGLKDKIRLEGKWSLDKNHDLVLTLDEGNNVSPGKKLVLKGKIMSVAKDSLVFELRSRDLNGQTHFQVLGLSGVWKADEYNRITFMVKRKLGQDALVFGGSWQLNRNQEISYSYEKIDLKTKTKYRQNLKFSGYWQIDRANKLTYILGRNPQSRFDFRVQVESPNLYPQQGMIKYRLGIGLKEKGKVRAKVITLYGSWKFSRKIGISFQIERGRQKLQRIEFKADLLFKHKNKVSISLISREREPLGLNLILTRKFLTANSEAFLSFKSLLDSPAIEAGITLPF